MVAAGIRGTAISSTAAFRFALNLPVFIVQHYIKYYYSNTEIQDQDPVGDWTASTSSGRIRLAFAEGLAGAGQDRETWNLSKSFNTCVG